MLSRYRTFNRGRRALRRSRQQMERVRSHLDYWHYRFSGRNGKRVATSTNALAVFVVPTYSRERARNIEPIVRNALRCDFLPQVVISNNNPELKLADWVRVRDPRLHLIDQPIRRGAGTRWIVARHFPSAYYISQDDDLFFTPEQISQLLEALVQRPDAPHGLAGSRAGVGVMNQETHADVLYNCYAATRAHLDTYFERIERLRTVDAALPGVVEHCCDDILMSNVGTTRAYVHDRGRLKRCATESSSGVAFHMADYFWGYRRAAWQGLKQLGYCAPDVPERQ